MDLPKFDRYEATGILGEGAMGTVYRGYDPRLKREVAIKTIKPDLLRLDPNLRARFEREAEAIAALVHPAIVQIFDFSGDYLVMELLQGEELRRLMRAGKRFTLPEVAYLLHQLADALDYAHSKGVVHRDLKPANLFIDAQNRPKLTDFGLAKLQGETMEGLTAAGKMVGTPAFMSPEQVQGQAVDGRSDQFSLAVVVYTLLAGKSPFAADSVTAIIHKIVSEEPPPLRSLAPGAPAALEPVLARALSKVPAARYKDCRGFAADFAKAAGVSGDPRFAPTTGWITPRSTLPPEELTAVRARQPAAAPAPLPAGETQAVSVPAPEPPARAGGRYGFAAGLLLTVLLIAGARYWFVQSHPPAIEPPAGSGSSPFSAPPPVTDLDASSAPAESAAAPASDSAVPAGASAPEPADSAPSGSAPFAPAGSAPASAPASIPAAPPESVASAPQSTPASEAAPATSTPLNPPIHVVATPLPPQPPILPPTSVPASDAKPEPRATSAPAHPETVASAPASTPQPASSPALVAPKSASAASAAKSAPGSAPKPAATVVKPAPASAARPAPKPASKPAATAAKPSAKSAPRATSRTTSAPAAKPAPKSAPHTGGGSNPAASSAKPASGAAKKKPAASSPAAPHRP